VGDDNSLIKEYVALAKKGEFANLVEKALGEIDLAAAKAGDGEFENFVVLISTLLYSKCNEGTFDRVGAKIVDAVAAHVDAKKSTRLSLLSTLYNMNTNSSWRLRLLVSLLKYAKSAELESALRPSVPYLEQRLILLGAKPAEKRTIYELALNVLGESEPTTQADMQIKLLKTFEANDTSAVVSTFASKFVVFQIKHPEIRYTDTLLALPAVAQLKGHTKLFDLLEIFVAKDFKTFSAFAAANKALFSEFGLDETALATKIRLLTLADLGAARDSLSFGEIADALQVPESEVEMWVVDAVGMSVIDALIDQSARNVSIVQAPQRVFEPQQWAHLSKRVADASKQLSQLLDTVRALRADHQKQVGAAQ